MTAVTIVLAGIGGYGQKYVEALLHGESLYEYRLVGTVDPFPEKSSYTEKLAERNIPNYRTMEQFYAERRADLAIICSPIQFHCPQTCLALSHGSHVLCEKPIGATVEDALTMIEARDRTDKFVAVGYQWSYSQGIQALKQDVISGLFGKPKRLRTIALWPRSYTYYARNWAGKRQDADGNMILDSVANNATAHYIHNMFYILGRATKHSARPSRITAELYRANDIENYDTAAFRAYTDHEVELLYFGSHAVHERVGAKFCYEFEKAAICYDEAGDGRIIAQFRDGMRKEYANPNLPVNNKLWTAIAAARGVGTIPCGLEEALPHTMCMSGMQASAGEICGFPEEMLRRNVPVRKGEKGTCVEGLVDQLKHCYEQAVLPAEAGYAWAKAGQDVYLP